MHIANKIIHEFEANNQGIEEIFHAITDPNWLRILSYFKDTPREERVLKMLNARLTGQFPNAFTDINVAYDEGIDSWVFSTFYI